MKQTNPRTATIGDDMLCWIRENRKGRILCRNDIAEYTGLSLSTVDRLTNGLNNVGGRGKYYYLDVAEKIAMER